ncbi:MAG: rhomboid family intramembrane serine protease [Lachnospiraceae bacterium]|nr:rhomboid family intramembrane serine protease [Lachnospiraceae bacterium]
MKKFRLKIVFNSPVVLSFVFISFAVMMIGFITLGRSNELLFMTYHSSLKNPLTYIRFFTHVLGHAGWDHYIGNMAYILLLGPILEEKYGSKKILEVIIITAAITGVINYLLFWDVALCGASGVVFAFILLTSFTSFKDGELPITFILVAVIFIGQQVYEGLFLQDNVSNLSHILGGIIGAVIGYNLNKK